MSRDGGHLGGVPWFAGLEERGEVNILLLRTGINTPEELRKHFNFNSKRKHLIISDAGI